MKFLVDTYKSRGITFVDGKGSLLIDQNGEFYLDLMTNIGVNIFGYGENEVVKAIKKQFSKLPNLHGSFNNTIRNRASIRLVKSCGGKVVSVYWSNSGTEAVEAAIKFAVLATGKSKFLAAKGGFHGKTLGALSLTSVEGYKKPFSDLLLKTNFVDYGDIGSLKSKINKRVAALIIEPILGEGGIVVPPKGYLKQVEKICRENDVLLIVDEIQTGMGRTGKFLASEWEAVEPDIVCLGKGLAGGIPVGATLVSEMVAKSISKGIHTSTFGGNPVACAATLAVMELLDTSRLKRNKELGDYFISKLKGIKNATIKQVRGKGLMIGVEVKGKNSPVLKKLQENFVVAAPASNNTIRFLPPFIITKKELDKAVKVLDQVLNS